MRAHYTNHLKFLERATANFSEAGLKFFVRPPVTWSGAFWAIGCLDQAEEALEQALRYRRILQQPEAVS